MVDNPQSANPDSSSPESSSSDSSGEAEPAGGKSAGGPQAFSSGSQQRDDTVDNGPFRGQPSDSSEAHSESFEGPSLEDFLSEAAEDEAGSTAYSGPEPSRSRDSDGSGAGFAYEMAKMWIRDNQKTAMVGASATGVFLGTRMRD